MPTQTATIDWTGNYSIAMAPFAQQVADALGVAATHTNHSAMLRQTHLEGSDAAKTAQLLAVLEVQTLEALRAWQKANIEARRRLTDMEKYLQHRSFIAGFGQAVSCRIAGRAIRNAKSDDAATRDGRAAGKKAEVNW